MKLAVDLIHHFIAQQGKPSTTECYLDLCKVMLLCARRAKDRGDVQAAKQVLDSLESLLAISAVGDRQVHNNDSLTALCNWITSVEACGGAVVGTTVALLFCGWQLVLFLTCLVCVSAYQLSRLHR